MDLPTSKDNDDDNGEVFFEALDDFHVPFYDCPESFSNQSDSSSSSSALNTPIPKSPSEPSLRRRRSSSRRISFKNSSLDKSPISEINSIEGSTKPSPNGKVHEIGGNSKEDNEKSEPFSSVTEQSTELSSISPAIIDSIDSESELDGSSFNLLIFVAGFMIKAIGFQFHLFIKFITFPISVLCTAYMFVIDPFYTMRRGREFIIGKFMKLWDSVLRFLTPQVLDWWKDNKSIEKMASRWFWGSIWAIYVCFILCSLLFSSILFSGLIMRCLVDKPVHMKKPLNFDFTKHSPVAFMPIISCVNAGCGMDCEEEQFKPIPKTSFRIIPIGHKLQASVSMTLPESDYNRNLGIFQVRLEFLSIRGETLSSSSHPWMLQFKSEPIRYLWTLLKAAPLVAGYVSESQTLNVKYKGFTEGDVSSGCLKVTIEQRAEFRAGGGGGVPEIYDGFLVLESELPLLKRLLWRWKISVFVWIAMTLFFVELLCALVCCNRIIMPRPRPRSTDGGGGLYRSAPLDAADQ